MADKEDLKLKAILVQVGKLQLSIEQVNYKIDKLEHNNHPATAEGVNASATINNTPDQRSIDNPNLIGPSDRTTAADIQAEFNRIRDSLLRTPRPYLMVSKCTIVRWAPNRRQKEQMCKIWRDRS